MNYTIYRKYREDGHGGVTIAIFRSVPSIHLPNFDTSCEIYGLNFALQIAKTNYVGALYRPHASDITSLEQLKISRNQPSDSVSAPKYGYLAILMHLT